MVSIFLVWELSLLSGGIGGAGAQPYPNVKVNTLSNWPEETSIGINPMNPQNVLGVAQSPCRTYVSMNGGASWTEGQLPDPFDLGDPVVQFDRNGTAYYCYIGDWSHSGIFINRSTDGGTSWRPAGTAVIEHDGDTPFEDKAWIGTDATNGPYGGSLYVSWTQFDHYGSSSPADSSRILFSRSVDGGFTFSPPIRVSDRSGDAVDADNTVEGATPGVGPNGAVYLAWAGPRGIEFDRSTNGGASFGTDRVISDQPGGWDFAVPGIFRVNGLPTLKVDPSPSPWRGRIYVCWSDQRHGDTDVFLIRSDDQGATWSPRLRVNDDPLGNGRDQFFPMIDVDPVNGRVAIVFYDRRDHADTATDVFLAVSEDGGATFQNVRVSASPFVPDPTIFFGDYIGVSALGGWIRPLWMRLDAQTLSLWTALINPLPSESSATIPTGTLRISPNPIRGGRGRLLWGPGNAPAGPVLIVDARGRVLRTLRIAPGSASLDWDAADAQGVLLPSGVYWIRGAGREVGRFVIVR